jgi:hypothetical protein
MVSVTRKLSWLGVVVLGLGCAVAVAAQDRSGVPVTGASLDTLTAELKQLRVAVEELTRSQTQTQALGVYLSVQQSRMLQVSARLDAARKDLDVAAIRSRDLAGQLVNIEEQLRTVTEPDHRAQLENAVRQLKYEQGTVSLQEQQARAREVELYQTLQVEEARWNDLISRLEQLTKR